LSRDWFGLFWIFAFPLMFALFFGSIFGGGPGRGGLKVGLVNEDREDPTGHTQEFIKALEQKHDALQLLPMGRDEAREKVRKGDLSAFVVIKPGFGQANPFFPGSKPLLEVGIDPARKADAGYLQGMLMEANFAGLQKSFADPREAQKQLGKALEGIERAKDLSDRQKKQIREFLKDMKKVMGKADFKDLQASPQAQPARIEQVEVQREGSRPLSSFEITFPSAVMWGLIGCITSFAISIVTERVAGTFLRLRIAPLSFSQLLAGKGLACFLASVTVAGFLLLLGHFVLGVRVENLLGLALAVVCTACCFVGIMMFLATLGKTEQGVAGAGWGLLMPLAMLGGGMVPLIFMPPWMQTASSISPIKWGIWVLEGAIWRDFTLAEMLPACGLLLAIGVVFYGLGVAKLARADG
jgi:ABC-2 type transport system permease protein